MFKTIRADLTKPSHSVTLINLLNQYALSPEGGGKALSKYVKANLASELSKRSGVTVIFAFDEEKPVGLINCIEGFSTFACKPLLNIHDVFVATEYRGRGIAKMMLEEVEKVARKNNCCKLTLEVLEGNEAAKSAYLKYGFQGYELDPEMGKALFWEKKL